MCVSYILRVCLLCFYLLLLHQNPPWTWGFVCVVLGVGVISVFDAVAFLACMHRVSSAHSNIPTTSQSDQKLSKNQTGEQYGATIVKLLVKHLASNPSWAKALNGESPTIVTPILTVEHQLRYFPLGTTAVMNARLDGAGEQTLSISPAKWLHGVPASLGVTRE